MSYQTLQKAGFLEREEETRRALDEALANGVPASVAGIAHITNTVLPKVDITHPYQRVDAVISAHPFPSQGVEK